MNGRTISAAWVKGIREVLIGAGLDPAALFHEAGLDLSDLDNPDVRYAPEKISNLWEIATKRSGNPVLGLKVTKASTPVSLDAVAYSMMSCPNLLAAMERLLRYQRIISDAADIALAEEKCGYAMTVELAEGGRPVPRQRSEFVMIILLNFFRWITGRHFAPLSVDFAAPVPVDIQPYMEAFGGTLNFDAQINRLVFSMADMMMPLPTYNPALAAVHDQYAIEHLNRMDDAKISRKTRELIILQLPNGDPSRANIAKALCMGERTLQRRLQEEGTSYHQLLDDTRQELAQQYLRKPHLTLAQITYLLGFGDPSTFCRACKRWFDLSPGEFRSNLSKTPTTSVSMV
jgi:AraC-like DNA-binding protein